MVELEYPFDSVFLLKKKKSLRSTLLAEECERIYIKVAILGGSTVADIKNILELFLLNSGFKVEFYESDYGKYWEESVFENLDLERFKPDIIFIHTGWRNITELPECSDTQGQINKKLEQEYKHFEAMWDKLRETYQCPIIQNNFERPLYRLLGNQDVSDYHGYSNFLFCLNQKLYLYSQTHDNFYVHDVDGLSAEFGLKKWHEPRYWYLYKYSLNMEAIPLFAYSLYKIIKSIYGKNKKLLVLDADNTLWGGLIGECGADNIEIGLETASGQAFREWQQYLLRLKSQGILLAVASKNELQSVVSGLSHPDSILHKDDFAHMKVNWEDKDGSLRQISTELNLGLDQIVFVDDNPAERELVRQMIPEAAVVEEDMADKFIQGLDAGGYFEVTKLTGDDLKRNEMYTSNKKRTQLENSFDNYDDYLERLDMSAKIKNFEPMHYSRISQLINKTNQFNLTARRYTEAEVAEMAKSTDTICLYGSLNDKFGDNGIVSILIAKIVGDSVNIELFVLSCRVFKRGMEFAMMNALADLLRLKEIKTIQGYFIPTNKNKIVSELYKSMGFREVEKARDSGTVWQCAVNEYSVIKHKIKVEV